MGDQGLNSEALLSGFRLDNHPSQGPLTRRGSGLAVTSFAVLDVMMSDGN